RPARSRRLFSASVRSVCQWLFQGYYWLNRVLVFYGYLFIRFQQHSQRQEETCAHCRFASGRKETKDQRDHCHFEERHTSPATHIYLIFSSSYLTVPSSERPTRRSPQ